MSLIHDDARELIKGEVHDELIKKCISSITPFPILNPERLCIDNGTIVLFELHGKKFGLTAAHNVEKALTETGYVGKNKFTKEMIFYQSTEDDFAILSISDSVSSSLILEDGKSFSQFEIGDFKADKDQSMFIVGYPHYLMEQKNDWLEFGSISFPADIQGDIAPGEARNFGMKLDFKNAEIVHNLIGEENPLDIYLKNERADGTRGKMGGMSGGGIYFLADDENEVRRYVLYGIFKEGGGSALADVGFAFGTKVFDMFIESGVI